MPSILTLSSIAKICNNAETSVTKLATQSNSPKLPSAEQNSFLGQKTNDSDTGEQEREATVISYPSASTKQVAIHQQLTQSHKYSPKGKQITSLDELPLVGLKDPIAARIPSTSTQQLTLAAWCTPPVTVKAGLKLPGSFTNTSTFTTSGYNHLQNRPAQFDGRDGISEARVRHSSLQRMRSQIPLRTSSQPNNK